MGWEYNHDGGYSEKTWPRKETIVLEADESATMQIDPHIQQIEGTDVEDVFYHVEGETLESLA